MLEPHITVVGNVGAPPRIRTLADGAIVTDFRIASTSRSKDRHGVWSDRETMWFGVTCWRAQAENVAASLRKGDRVVVSGQLTAESWKDEQGEVRSGMEIINASVGLDLSRGKAVLEKNPPLSITTDPGYRVVADETTGEVLSVHDDDLPGGEDDDLQGDDEVSLGRPAPALV